jgi:hypothetical protein
MDSSENELRLMFENADLPFHVRVRLFDRRGAQGFCRFSQQEELFFDHAQAAPEALLNGTLRLIVHSPELPSSSMPLSTTPMTLAPCE